MRILVSACLLGVKCRYDGGDNFCPAVAALMEKHELIPVCPEMMGGLPTPRPPAEIQGDTVVNNRGRDVTGEYARGAEQALDLAKLFGCRYAVLKERSPSCGCSSVYDGSFSHTLVEGQGVTARLLTENGVKVLGESEVENIL